MILSHDLTFDVVDDLTSAFAKGRLGVPPPIETRFKPIRLGPMLELAFHANTGRHGPLLHSQWLDTISLGKLRRALSGAEDLWIDDGGLSGLLRTTYQPSNPDHDIPRTKFLMAARRGAERAGFSIPTAQTLTAALREMESNIHEHSKRSSSGILAFLVRPSAFEYAVADAGVGVLETIREAREYESLRDHGSALHLALQEGVSRYGAKANRGMGFRDLFVGLATLNADLRFRSGDHALTISGSRPELKTAQLSQKPFFQGFLTSVSCRLLQPAGGTH